MEPTAAPTTPQQPSRFGKVAARVVVVGLVAMWAYVLYLAIGPGRADSPDKLDDPTFAADAQARCDAALTLVAALPPASESPDPVARADVLEEADTHLAAMLRDLRQIVPPGEDGQIVSEWLDDWDVYLGDREDYVEALRTEPNPRLLVSPKGGNQVTDFIDQFAKDNAMPACSTPADAA